MHALRYLYEIGEPLLLGSDTPSARDIRQPAGLRHLSRDAAHGAGRLIPLSAIFSAATINNARRLGMEKDYGTIEHGNCANLLLLDANPLARVEAWARIDKVILHGEPIERESLAAEGLSGAAARDGKRRPRGRRP